MTQTNLTDDWATTASESQSAPAQDASGQTGSVEDPQTEHALCEQAAVHAATVAAEHFPELPVEAITWETLSRTKHSAEKAIYNPRRRPRSAALIEEIPMARLSQ